MSIPQSPAHSSHPSKHSVLAAVLMILATTPSVHAEIDGAIENALKFGQSDGKYGQITFDLNYRYEYADTDNTPPEPAHGNTFRLRLGYLTPEISDTQAFVEYENLFAVQNDYNSPVYGDPRYHVIADPADRHELNQLWLTYKGFSNTEIKGGRQRIKIDDDRFIGNVGWRQMEQTFDAVMATNTSIQGVTVKAGYIGRVRNIFSLNDNIEAPFVNVNYKLGEFGNAVGYGYWLDYRDDAANFGKSRESYGVRFVGEPKLSDDLTVHYLAEYTYQQDYGKNAADFALDRYHIQGGVTVLGITIKGAMEQLDGDNGSAFQTPLGTNHAFQGWADRFLVTPGTGLRDIYASAGTKLLGAKLMFVYHKFEDDTGNTDYADEYNVLIAKKFGKHFALLGKYAYYDGDDNAPGAFKNDTQKVWLQVNLSY